MKTDDQLQKEIIKALYNTPILKNAEIGVVVQDSVAVLSGEVDSRLKKSVAEKTALTITGIRHCEAGELKLLPTASKTDQEVIAAIHKALEWYPGSKHNLIQIEVDNGNVILGGVVDLEYKRGNIERAVEALAGVRSVVNRIKA